MLSIFELILFLIQLFAMVVVFLFVAPASIIYAYVAAIADKYRDKE
jgi:hypothetical protein